MSAAALACAVVCACAGRARAQDVFFVTVNGSALGLIDPGDARNTRVVGEFRARPVLGLAWRAAAAQLLVSLDPVGEGEFKLAVSDPCLDGGSLRNVVPFPPHVRSMAIGVNDIDEVYGIDWTSFVDYGKHLAQTFNIFGGGADESIHSGKITRLLPKAENDELDAVRLDPWEHRIMDCAFPNTRYEAHVLQNNTLHTYDVRKGTLTTDPLKFKGFSKDNELMTLMYNSTGHMFAIEYLERDAKLLECAVVGKQIECNAQQLLPDEFSNVHGGTAVPRDLAGTCLKLGADARGVLKPGGKVVGGSDAAVSDKANSPGAPGAGGDDGTSIWIYVGAAAGGLFVLVLIAIACIASGFCNDEKYDNQDHIVVANTLRNSNASTVRGGGASTMRGGGGASTMRGGGGASTVRGGGGSVGLDDDVHTYAANAGDTTYSGASGGASTKLEAGNTGTLYSFQAQPKF